MLWEHLSYWQMTHNEINYWPEGKFHEVKDFFVLFSSCYILIAHRMSEQ